MYTQNADSSPIIFILGTRIILECIGLEANFQRCLLFFKRTLENGLKTLHLNNESKCIITAVKTFLYGGTINKPPNVSPKENAVQTAVI